MRGKLLFILGWLSISSLANNNIYFEHITQSNGLPSNDVNQIFQDSDGLMWFVTYNGLASYDGYSFKEYRYSPTDSTTISHDLVLHVTEENPRYLWIGTYRGFCRYDKELDKFKRYTSPNLGEVSNSTIRKIVFDNENNVWLATNGGLAVYNQHTDSLTFYTHDPKDTNTICDGSILELYFDSNNQVWIGSRTGLDLFDRESKKFTHLYKDEEFEKIIPYKQGVLAISRNFNRYYTPSVTSIEFEENLFTEDKPGFVFTDMLTNYQGAEWYAIREYGIFVNYYNNREPANYTYSKYNSHGLNSNVPQCLFRDRDDNLWIGTFDGGVNFYSPYRKVFHNIRDNFLETGLMNNKVKTIYQDRDGDIWVGTKVGGMLSKFDINTHTFTHYHHDPNDPFSISDDYIFAITDAEPGYLWVGTMNGGLNHFNKKTGKCTVFKHDPDNNKSITYNNIKTLFVDDNILWISYHRMGLDKFDLIEKTKIKNYRVGNEPQGNIASNSTNRIFKDFWGRLWFATFFGLSRYDYENDTFINYYFNENDTAGISDNMIFCIHEDHEHNVWIGTKNGLNKYNPETDNFTIYNTKTGLPTNSIYGLSSEKDGILWISTNIGLCRYEWKDKKARLYTVEDGLQNNEFVPSIYETSKEGYIFFGGNEGFTYFKPDEIIDNPIIPNILFTDFKIFNKSVKVGDENDVLDKHISKVDHIRLKHWQSVFSFEFTAINYNSTSKNQYAYMMEGFDSDWQQVGTMRSATYTNLNPGDYIFRVKATNNDGLWNETGISLKVTILPAWWETWTFRILLLLLIAAFIVLFFKYRTRLYRKQKVLLEKMVKERTLKLDNANIELTKQKEEILQQNQEIQNKTEEIILQRDEIKKQNEILEKESKKIKIINQFGQELTNILSVDAIHRMMYNYVASILDTAIFGIGLYDQEKNAIIFSSLIEKGKTIDGFSRQLDDTTSCAAWCYNNQQYIFLNNFREDYKQYITAIRHETSKIPESVIYLTLTVKDKKIGVLTIQSYNRNAYTQVDLDTIQTLASYLAIALDNANIYKIVRTQKAELESQHIILEQQVKERTKDLEDAKLRAEESDKLKSSFLANMSHEIRTPLNAIVGFSNVIVSDDFSQKERKEMFTIIQQNSFSLLNIISDIIDFSKIEAGQMDFQIDEVELTPILKELLRTFTQQLKNSEKDGSIILRLNVPDTPNVPKLNTDSFRLKQIFSNLISNAIKFTDKGYIEFGFRETKNGSLILFVKDTGIGIKNVNKKVIFDRFVKIEDDKDIIYRGTGLGLSITKYLVESLGGKIWVESKYHEGSEFLFELPILEKQSQIAQEGIKHINDTSFITPDWHNKTVLIVEDESSNFRLIEMLLKSTKIKIEWAKDGNEAILQLKKLKDLIDLVLLDIKLPRKNGFEVFKEIRSVNDSLPIIAQTAYAMQNEEEKIRQSGFNDYLSKPLVKQKLIESMARFI